MKNTTRAKYQAFAQRIAELNNVENAYVGGADAVHFTPEPSVQQRLVERMQDSSAFLSMINVVPVEQLKGETLGLNVASPTASRANTDAGNRRVPVDPTGLDQFPYELAPTEFNILFKYNKLDMWAKFPNFEVLMRDAIIKRQALDRILIGFNGVSVDASFDPVADPTLKGMNIGWLQWMRANNPARVLSAGAKVAGKVTWGPTGADYVDLDALVWDAKMTLLPPWAREDPELVVVVGSDMLHDKYFPIINAPKDPMDRLATDVIMSTKRIGQLPAVRVPYMPTGKLMITRLDNLSIYYQEGHQRRMLRDEPQYNRVVDYQSSNEAYVVEDANFACMVENIAAVGVDEGVAA
ncbi:major capsid protein precursor [Novosphingobium nitrogenifigens DSM 19370]|uniref:Major capsid protein n=1 Tax=Novosphingobium nitrogenifigens DSM 19370 TaxID=983920 RepID=F1Z9A3_9SPHN|nr:phage major capsid protein, P2 family [Novosphingobium nitrogenifigens]EGD58402.1 major capsid protein precursor [Novosphingobium nitrogenifigens DSM 19370]